MARWDWKPALPGPPLQRCVQAHASRTSLCPPAKSRTVTRRQFRVLALPDSAGLLQSYTGRRLACATSLRRGLWRHLDPSPSCVHLHRCWASSSARPGVRLCRVQAGRGASPLGRARVSRRLPSAHRRCPRLRRAGLPGVFR